MWVSVDVLHVSFVSFLLLKIQWQKKNVQLRRGYNPSKSNSLQRRPSPKLSWLLAWSSANVQFWFEVKHRQFQIIRVWPSPKVVDHVDVVEGQTSYPNNINLLGSTIDGSTVFILYIHVLGTFNTACWAWHSILMCFLVKEASGNW